MAQRLAMSAARQEIDSESGIAASASSTVVTIDTASNNFCALASKGRA